MIKELLNEEHVKGVEYISKEEQAKLLLPPQESKGAYRVLKPSVLERFPQMDRHKIDFPAYVHDYFFGARETVLSHKQMEDALHSQHLHGKDPDESYQGHGYTDMHARHSYITTHMFYEDLRNLQDSLPPMDIYEQLNSKDDVDTIDEANFEDDEERKRTEVLAEQFIYQSESDDSGSDEREEPRARAKDK